MRNKLVYDLSFIDIRCFAGMFVVGCAAAKLVRPEGYLNDG